VFEEAASDAQGSSEPGIRFRDCDGLDVERSVWEFGLRFECSRPIHSNIWSGHYRQISEATQSFPADSEP
jgi:hypothetical protein